MAKKRRAALICRVSTPQQIKLGLETQVACLKRKAIKDGYDVPDSLIFQEQISGLDAKKPIRKSLQDLMDAVEEHQVDVCYTYELTRISRDPYNLVERVKWFTDRKIPMYIYDADMWTLDRETKEEIEETTSYVFGAATYGKVEVRKMKERTKRGRNEVAKEGLYVGHLSDGYCVKQTERGKEIVIDDDRKAVIEEIFNLYEQGFSTDRIAEHLNMNDTPTASKYRLHSPRFKGYQDTYHKKISDVPMKRDDTKWQGSVVGQYLRNRWYIGERKYNEGIYYVEPIISKEQWNIVDAMLQENAISFRSKRESRKHLYLLNRLIYCGKCGKRMYGHYTGLNNHYYCPSIEEGEKCGLRGVNKENVEALVTVAIKNKGLRDIRRTHETGIIGGFFSTSPKEESRIKKEVCNNNLLISKYEEREDELDRSYVEAVKQSIIYADDKNRRAVCEKLIKEIEEEKVNISNKKYRLLQINILNSKKLRAKSNIQQLIFKILEETNLNTLRDLFLETVKKVVVYNLTPSVDIIRITFVDDDTEDYIYAYRLMKMQTIPLSEAVRIKGLIYYDAKDNMLRCTNGAGIIRKYDFIPVKELEKNPSLDVQPDEKEGVDYYVVRDGIIDAKEFVKYALHHTRFRFSFERLEGLTEEAKVQDSKYKEWRKKYNTGLPTSVPYLVKDENYDEIAKKRKHLYNRKNKIKMHKRLTEEEKNKKMRAIDEELALLKAKLKYLNREEAVKEYRKKQEEELERKAGEALE